MDMILDIRTSVWVQALVVPVVMIGLLVWFFVVVSRFGAALAQERARIYGTPPMKTLHLGALMPAANSDTSAQAVAYRAFYRRQCKHMALKSVVIWLCIYGLSLI